MYNFHKLLKNCYLSKSRVSDLVQLQRRAEQIKKNLDLGRCHLMVNCKLFFLILTDKLLSFVNLLSYTAACKIGSGAPNGDESVWSEQDGFSVFVRCSCDWIVGWGLTDAQCNVYKMKSSNFLNWSWGQVSETIIRHIFC